MVDFFVFSVIDSKNHEYTALAENLSQAQAFFTDLDIIRGYSGGVSQESLKTLKEQGSWKYEAWFEMLRDDVTDYTSPMKPEAVTIPCLIYRDQINTTSTPIITFAKKNRWFRHERVAGKSSMAFTPVAHILTTDPKSNFHQRSASLIGWWLVSGIKDLENAKASLHKENAELKAQLKQIQEIISPAK